MLSKVRLIIIVIIFMIFIVFYERKILEELWEKSLIYVGFCEKNVLIYDNFQDKDYFINLIFYLNIEK